MEPEENIPLAPGAAAALARDALLMGQQAAPGAVAASKREMIALMQALERGVVKARRGVEADRPLRDLAPMFEQLRKNFEKLTQIGSDFEKKTKVRDDHLNKFMTDRSAQLNGLQSHLLGEVPPNSKAGKAFKKAAYVADSYNTNRQGGGVVRNLV